MRAIAAPLLLILLAVSSVCLAEEPVELRFRPKVKDEQKYQLLIAGRMETSSGEEGGERDRSEVVARIEYATEAISKAENETLVKTRSLTCEAKLSCGEAESTLQMSPFTQVARYDERRRITDVDEYDGGEVPECDDMPDEVWGLPGMFDIGCGMWSDICDLLILPEKAVKVGATWAHEEEWEHADTTHVKTYRLEGITTRQGRKCARIAVSWRTDYSTAPRVIGGEEMAEMPATDGVSTGEFIWYYDYENGVDVYVEGAKGTESTTEAWESTTKTLMNVKIILAE